MKKLALHVLLYILLIIVFFGIVITSSLHFVWLLFTSPRRIKLAFHDFGWWWKRFRNGGL